MGATFKKEEVSVVQKGIRVLRGGNILPFKLCLKPDDIFIPSQKVNANILLRANDIVTPAVTSLGNIGKMARVEAEMPDTTVGGFVFIIRPIEMSIHFSKYLLTFMSSPVAIEYIKSITNKSGQAFYNIGKERLLTTLVPLPPTAEQKRLTDKLDELLSHIEAYGNIQNELNSLNLSIKTSLKKSILQEAIKGNLVPQIAEEGTAQELLEQIRQEKQKLIKEGKLKKSAIQNSVIFKGDDNRYYEQIGSSVTDISEEIPFDAPANWRWVRLSAVANLYTGNSISEAEKKQKYTGVEGVEYIGTKDVGFDHKVQYSNGVNIPNQYMPLFKIAPRDSVLLCIEGGSAGRKVAIIDRDVCFGNKLCCLSPYTTALSKYIFYYLQSPLFFESFRGNIAGIIGGVSVNTLKTLIMPLPPSLEQKRIVQSIDELFEQL